MNATYKGIKPMNIMEKRIIKTGEFAMKIVLVIKKMAMKIIKTGMSNSDRNFLLSKLYLVFIMLESPEDPNILPA
jgi:hypothetical protein